jgi:hypothetical protein
LHWYRSTLAHSAPLINGHSQRRIDGSLLAHDERGGVGWTFAEANGLEAKVRVTRAVIVTPDYFVDEVRWNAQTGVRFELPIHFDGELRGAALETGMMLDGGAGLEDGFEFVTNVRGAELRAAQPVELVAARDGRSARGFVCAEASAQLFRAEAPGQPARETRPFYVVRCEGTSGVIRSVWAWSDRVEGVQFTGGKVAITLGAERHVHYQTDAHWQMELTVGGAQSGIELTGWTPGNEPGSAERESRMRPRLAERRPARKPMELPRAGLAAFDLGERNYRRSEATWDEAGRPSARVTIAVDGDELIVEANVHTGELVFVPANASNPYDNEHPDVNGHGVQLYVRTFFDAGAWMLVPEQGATAARVRPLEGWGSLVLRGATWEKTASGFSVRARVALPAMPPEYPKGVYPGSIDVLVNETEPGRERRRGQLVLSGAQDEFVYLRGDRHDPPQLVPLLIVG